MNRFVVASCDYNCGRCGKQNNDNECCWYCNAYLCFECWDKYGHCGHKEADEVNEKLRQEQVEATK